MSQISKEDVKQEVFDLYDDYAHSRIDRRAFVQKLSVYAVGGLTVSALMSFLMPDYQGNVQKGAERSRRYCQSLLMRKISSAVSW